MQWYLKVLQNYVGFQGRARRTEYWMFFLFNFIIGIVLGILGAIIGLGNGLNYLYSLAILLPSLAVGVRRLHDTGKSGLWLLIALVPFVGAIVLLVFMCLDSEEGTNQYGPNPKY
ncbi:Inner membrane protein YhaI [compost metagenome]